MKSILLFLLGSIGITFPILGSDNPLSQYQWYKDVNGGESGKLATVEIDEEIYHRIGPSKLPHALFLSKAPFDSTHPIQLPYLIEKRPHKSARKRGKVVRMEPLALEELDTGAILVTWGLPERENSIHSATLELGTTERNFESELLISSSADLKSWDETPQSAVIFDYSRYLDFRRTDIEIVRERAFRFLRIEIRGALREQTDSIRKLAIHLDSNGVITGSKEFREIESKSFRFDSVELRTEKKAEQRLEGGIYSKMREITQTEIEESDQEFFAYTWDVGFLPVTSIQIDTADVNFKRRIQIQRFDEKLERWVRISEDNLYRYRFVGFEKEDLWAEIQETRSGRMRFLIRKDQSPQLTISQVEISGPRYDLVFDPGTTREACRLYFGKASRENDMVSASPPPLLDRSALQAAVGAKVARIPAQLGETQRNSAFLEKPNQPGLSQGMKTGLLYGVIILLIAVLIPVILSAAKKIESETESE